MKEITDEDKFTVEGRIRPIATTILHGLNPKTMRTPHEQVESSRTVGKVVIAFDKPKPLKELSK
jgi:hypothetical protein